MLRTTISVVCESLAGTGATSVLARSSARLLILSGKLKLDLLLWRYFLVQSRPSQVQQPFPSSVSSLLFWTLSLELEGKNIEGVLVLKQPWSVYNDYNHYLGTYMKPYPGLLYTRDDSTQDEHDYIWIEGHIDDVINVFGHRLSTAEIESTLIMHKGVAEPAVMGATDELTGQAVFAFATLKPEFAYDPNIDPPAML